MKLIYLLHCAISQLLLVCLFCEASENPVNTTQFESCSCDMTAGWCDVHCCCDEDCDDSQKESFACTGTKEDAVQQNIFHYKCSDTLDSPEQGFHQLLCLHKENSPYLGHYFADYQIISDLPTLNEILLRKNNPSVEKDSQFSKNGLKYMIDSNVENGYYYMQELVVISKNLRTSTLSLPYSVFGGACDAFRSVKYLEDSESTCLTDAKSILREFANFDSFLVGSNGQKLLGSPLDEFALRNVTVEYFYISQKCCYLYNSNCSRPTTDNCSLEAYNFISESHPPEVAILEASYLFYWKGGRIYNADARITFGNISSTDGMVQQKFSVNFKHVKAKFTKNSKEKNILNQKSLGYKIGDYVVGYYRNNFTDGDDGNENVTSSWTWFQTLTNNEDGSCGEDSSNPVRFGIDQLSGCFYVADELATTSCSELQNKIEEKLELIPAMMLGALSSTGSSDDHDSAIVIEDDAEIEPQNGTKEEDDDAPLHHNCPKMLHHISFELFYADNVVRLDGSDLTSSYVIVRVLRRLQSTSWRPNFSPNSFTSSTSRHAIYVSIHFRHVPVQDAEERRRTKRSKLPKSDFPDQCLFETCWKGIFYPFLATSEGLVPDEILSRIAYVMFLAIVLLSSAAFLFGGVSKRRVAKC